MNQIDLYDPIAPMEKNFPIKFRYVNEKDYYPLHWHENVELLYFRTGVCKVICGGESYQTNPGDLFIVNQNELHSTENNGTGSFFCIRIAPSFFSDVACENAQFVPFIANDSFITDCFEQIFTEQREMQEGYDMQLKSLVYGLMAHIIRNYKTENLTENELLIKKTKMHRMGDILLYISQHYQSRLTTTGLAEAFHLTDHYFCSLFKKETGQSPIDYINKFRIEKACVLLKNTDKSITHIAQQVGFDDSNYFSRIFKKYNGVSPRYYRK